MKRAAVILTAIAALALAAYASAGVSVFKTSFSTRAEYSSITRLSGSGKACKRSWRGKRSLGVIVKGGEVDCALATPVEGDSKKPNHIVKAVAVVSKKETDKKVKSSVYVGVAVRADARGDYELRIFPKTRRWQLVKSGEVIEQNRDKKAIEGLDEKNRMEISAIGNRITVKANGKRLTEFGDKDASQVKGRKTALVYGSRKKSKRAEGVAFFDKLKVQVPTS